MVFEVIVTFEGDLVDDRILDHLDDQGIALAPEGDVGEEAGGEEILQGLVDAVGSKGIAGVELHVGAHRVRLDTLRALDLDVGDGIAAEHVLGERRGDGRQERQKHQGEAGRQQQCLQPVPQLPYSLATTYAKMCLRNWMTFSDTRSFQVANSIKLNTRASPRRKPHSSARGPSGRPRTASAP